MSVIVCYWPLGKRLEIISVQTESKFFAHPVSLTFYFIFFCQMCKGDSSVMVETGDENIALLNQLKRSNPEKFKK